MRLLKLQNTFMLVWLGLAIAACGDNNSTPDAGADADPNNLAVVPKTTLLDEDTIAPSQTLGYSMAMHGGRLIVGAPGAAPNAINGKAIIYRLDGTSWLEETQLTNTGTGEFGSSVAIGGDVVAIGSVDEVNVYRRTGANWNLEKTITSTAGGEISLDQTGTLLAIGNGFASGKIALHGVNQGNVGNWGEVKAFNRAGLGFRATIAGDLLAAVDNDDNAIFVYERNQGGADNWGELTSIAQTPLDTNTSWGQYFSLSEERLVIDTRVDSNGTDSGEVSIYKLNAGAFALEKTIVGSNVDAQDYFHRTAYSGSLVVVGAPGDEHMDANQSSQFGAAHVFHRDIGGAGNWGELAYLAPNDLAAGDEFGSAVATNGEYIAISAPWADNGDGRVYLYQVGEFQALQ